MFNFLSAFGYAYSDDSLNWGPIRQQGEIGIPDGDPLVRGFVGSGPVEVIQENL